MGHSHRNQLVVDNLPLVGYLVNDLCARATHLSRDDLASAGALALVQAADAFDPELGVPFGAYARRRILGAFADDMRSADWATRGARQRIKATLSVQATLTASLGRTPTVDELAEALGVDRESVTAALQDADRVVDSLDESVGERLVSDFVSPEASLLQQERSGYLRAAIAALPEKMRYIVEQVYLAERSVKDLAEELGATHSAVSQQRSEAIRLLRDGLNEHYGESATPVEPESRIAPTRRTAYLTRLAEYAQTGLLHQLADSRMPDAAAS